MIVPTILTVSASSDRSSSALQDSGDIGIEVFTQPVRSVSDMGNTGVRNQKAELLFEEFENGGSPPAGWDYSDWTWAQWEMTIDSARYGAICGAGDYATMCDSDAAGTGAVDSWIKTPIIDCSAATNLHLTFFHQYNWFGETGTEGIYIYIATDGSVDASDTQVYHQNTADIALEELDLDISSIVDGQSNVQIGWRYVADYDYWWVIDTVSIREFSDYPVSSVDPISPYEQTAPFTVTATASDSDGSVTGVDLHYRYSGNNISWGTWTLFGSDVGFPWEWTFDFPDGSGYYEFYSIAHDDGGMTEGAPVSADTSCSLAPPPTFYTETFENGGALPIGWTTSFTGRDWEATIESARYGAICGPGDYAMTCDSDRAGSGVVVDAWLISPIIDCSNREFIELVIDHRYDWYGETSAEGAYIYVANDGSVDAGDAMVFHEYTQDIALETRRVNISAAADRSADVQIGFRYVANYDYWWVVDDLLLQGYIADQVAPAQVDTLTGSAGDAQVDLDWTGYDEAGQGDVEGYRVYHDLSPISDVSSLTPVTTVPAGTFQYTVIELRNGVDHYFAVTAIDEVPNEDPIVIDLGPLVPLPYQIVNIPLDTGWNLISIPVIQVDTGINTVLGSIAGQWDYAMWFDSSLPGWRTYATFRPASVNTLTDVDHTMAIWLNVNSPCTLVVAGAVAQTTDIGMVSGWNFVGYPSMDTGTTIADAMSGIPYDALEGYSGSGEYNLQPIPDTTIMLGGEGYWVHTTGPATWSLSNDVMAPLVDSTYPIENAVDIPVTAAIDVTFTEEMEKLIAEAAFQINTAIPGSFSWNPPGTVMTFTPSSPLIGGPTTYSVSMDKTACDMSQNTMPWAEAFDFTTEDITPPTVTGTWPLDGTMDAPPGDDIIVYFSEGMAQGPTEGAFSIVPVAAGVFSWSPDSSIMYFNPDSTLSLLTPYSVTISTAAQDIAGNNLPTTYTFGFTTSADPVERHAIIIGISDYQFISDLSYCDEDATDIYYYLVGLGYTCEIYGDGPAGSSSFPIYTGDADEATVRAAIQSRVALLTSNDYFVYTTSGHGDGDGSGSSYLCQWDCSGSAGCYYDTEVQADFIPCVAERQFVFIDHCFAGGMGPELMVMPNSLNVYVGTTCTEDGYGWDDGAHLNGMWTYWFWEAGWDGQFGQNPATPMEDVWAWAAANYPYQPPSGDAPMEFDGDPGTDFIL